MRTMPARFLGWKDKDGNPIVNRRLPSVDLTSVEIFDKFGFKYRSVDGQYFYEWEIELLSCKPLVAEDWL